MSLVRIKHNEQLFIIINVYAYNEDNPNYWLEVFKKFEQYESNQILVGDFNLALDPKMDRSDPLAKNNSRSAEIINKYMEDKYLQDIWRMRNSDRIYTFCRMRPKFIGSRIDYILTDATIHSWVSRVHIIPGFRTDHSAVVINLEINQVKRGKRYWKLNTNVLFEIEYLDLINQAIEEVRQKAEHINKRELWELTKLEIIARSQNYCNERAINRKLIFAQLEQKVIDHESKIEALTIQEKEIYKRTKSDVKDMLDQKAQAAIFKAG